MLDIVLFRTDQGGNPDLVRESQRRRYADVTLVDKVIEHDTEWRKSELHSLSHSPFRCSRASTLRLGRRPTAFYSHSLPDFSRIGLPHALAFQ